MYFYTDEYNCFREGYTINMANYLQSPKMNITVFERDTQSMERNNEKNLR